MENPFDPNKKDKRLRGRALTKRTYLVVRDFGLATPEPSGSTPYDFRRMLATHDLWALPRQKHISKFES